MAGDRIERDVLIEAPIDVVWEVISRPEHIVHWFSDEAQLDLRPGGEGVLTFGMKTATEPADYHLRVEGVEGPRQRAADRPAQTPPRSRARTPRPPPAGRWRERSHRRPGGAAVGGAWRAV